MKQAILSPATFQMGKHPGYGGGMEKTAVTNLWKIFLKGMVLPTVGFTLSPGSGRVCYLIGNHHSYAKIDDIDFQIRVEADLMVDIFKDQIKIKKLNVLTLNTFKLFQGKKF